MAEKFKDKTLSENYKSGLSYQKSMDFPSKWAEYERFLAGQQWSTPTERTKTLPRPVFNVINYILSHKKASVQSETLKMVFTPEELGDGVNIDPEIELAKKGALQFTKYSESCWEKMQFDKLNDELLVSASNIGSGFAHFYWDNTIIGGIVNKYVGEITGEFIDPSNIFFGNPQVCNIQKQPWILIASRELVDTVKQEAKANGVPKEMMVAFEGDKDTSNEIYDGDKTEVEGSDKLKVLTKYYFKNGTVHFKKTCNDIVIKQETNTELRLYPVALMNWRPRKNCIYGTGDTEGIIPNQKAINLMLALQLLATQNNAWPKIITRPGALKQKITNVPGEIITDYSMNGDGVRAFSQNSYDTVALGLTDKIVDLTKEFSNANESAMGISPGADTSAQAIMLLQKNAGVSLSDIKERYYRYVEDCGRIWAEFWCKKYNMPRPIIIKDNDNMFTDIMVGTDYAEIPFSLKIDIGASSNYSEIAQQATLDKLFEMGAIDVVMYVKYSSENSVPHKESLLQELQINKENAMNEMAQMGQAPPVPKQAPPMEEPVPIGGDIELGIPPVQEPSMNYVKQAMDTEQLLPGVKL